MQKIIWTPDLQTSGHDFKIYLDKDFAREMIQSKVPSGSQIKMNELATEELKRLGTRWLNSYSFHEDSCFVNQIYTGHNGKWLSVNHHTIDDLVGGKKSLKVVEYSSHNIDTAKQIYDLMKLFDKWVVYADILKAS